MGNGAWGALGAAAVIATASSGCGHGADHARAQRVGALATAVVGDDAGGDESGVSEVDAAQGTPEAEAPQPEAEAPDTESVPDVVVVDDVSIPGDENEQSSGDDGSGTSSGGSGSSSGGIIIIYLDSGNVVPPTQTVDAAVESGGPVDSGNETASPTPSSGGREAGTVNLHGFGLPSSGTGTGNSPSSVGLDTSPYGDDSSPPWGDAAVSYPSYYGDDGGGSPNLDLGTPRAVIGCAGCSVPDASGSGALAWLTVALTAGIRIWRRRR
jgi:MYXO-CTERM domain-containing protein